LPGLCTMAAWLTFRLVSILPIVFAEPPTAKFRGANTTRALSASCTCSEGFPYCSYAGICYLSSGSWSHSQQCLGTCTHSAPEPKAADYVLERIRNDRVEHEMAFAAIGSSMPEMFHGIWWMDQFCYHVDATDPEYAKVCNFGMRVPEMLISWGEAEWDAESKCTSRIYQNGGAKGHWTFNDMGSGANNVWTSDGAANACLSSPQWSFLQFCCADSTCETIDVGVFFEDKFLTVATSMYDFSMVRKPWGWDRVTRGVFSEWHYPVFQIIDGNGARTPHYDAYLQWAGPSRSSGCGSCCGGCTCSCTGAGNLSCGWNAPVVPGTSLLGRLRAP